MTHATPSVPHSRCYWVNPGMFLAGSYPGEKDPELARDKLARILDAGVRTFISLMESSESNYDGEPFTPYQPIAESIAATRGGTRPAFASRFAIGVCPRWNKCGRFCRPSPPRSITESRCTCIAGAATVGPE